MLIQIINKQGQIIVQFESNETNNIATNQAMNIARKITHFFAVYVNGRLDCFTESAEFFVFPKTI